MSQTMKDLYEAIEMKDQSSRTYTVSDSEDIQHFSTQ